MSKRKEFKNRQRILTEAHHRCEVCSRDNNLHIHHRDFDNSNNTFVNAQVVCGDCHSALHQTVLKVEWDDHIAKVRRRDFEIEQKLKDAWVESGRSLDEIGGQESAEFFSDYLLQELV